MKTFIISYIISLSALVFVWLPDVMARPFHIVPRLAFYMAFPVAVFVSIILIVLGSYFDIFKFDDVAEDLPSHDLDDILELNMEDRVA